MSRASSEPAAKYMPRFRHIKYTAREHELIQLTLLCLARDSDNFFSENDLIIIMQVSHTEYQSPFKSKNKKILESFTFCGISNHLV